MKKTCLVKSRREIKLLKEYRRGQEVTAKSRHRWMSLWVDLIFIPIMLIVLKKKKGSGVGMLALCLQILFKKRKEMYDSHRPPSQRARTKYNNPFLL